MSTQQATLTAAGVGERSRSAPRQGQALAKRVFAWLDRAMLGGATPRECRRERFPEIELHQVISGRIDRLDIR
jgi:hypothetical protein